MAFLIDHLTGSLSGGLAGAGLDTSRILRRLAQGRQAGLMLRAGAMALAGGVLLWGALAGAEAMLATREAGAAADAVQPVVQAWSAVIRPIPIYDLGGTDFAKLPRSYEARRHAPDGAREDVLSFGSLGDGRPYLRLALERRGEEMPEPGNPSLADALARVAGTAGDTVARIRPLPEIETRFGTLDRADLLVWHDGTSTDCQGFRGLPNGGKVLAFTGFACRSAERPLADTAVACAVDRIDLLSAGEDRALRALFVAAERRPGAAACGEGALAASAAPPPTPGPFAAMRRRAAWLEAGSAGPPLRGPLDAGDEDR